MLTLINGLPDNVLGVSGEGKITGKEYEAILIPAIEDKLKRNKKISLLYQLGGKFEGFDLSGLLDDAMVGMKHLFSWDKIALVSDDNMVNTTARFLTHIMPYKLKVFNGTELEEAKKWVSS